MKLSDLLDWLEESLIERGESPDIYSERGGFCLPCIGCSGELHIRVNRYGQVSLNCQGGDGYPQSDILDRLDLTSDDLYTGMSPWDVEVSRLVKLAEEKCHLTHNRYGQAEAGVRMEDDTLEEETLLVRSEKFKAWLSDEYWRMEEHAPSGRSLTAAQRTLERKALQRKTTDAGPPHRLMWCLEQFAEERGPWLGTVSGLFGCLAPGGTHPAPGDDWPATPRGLRSMIEKCSQELQKLGIEVRFLKREPGKGGRLVAVRKLTSLT